MKKKPKTRKPTRLRFRDFCYDNAFIDAETSDITVEARDISPREARTLAAWLIKAAEWIESQETK